MHHSRIEDSGQFFRGSGLRHLVKGLVEGLRIFGCFDLPRRIHEALGFFGIVGLGF